MPLDADDPGHSESDLKTDLTIMDTPGETVPKESTSAEVEKEVDEVEETTSEDREELEKELEAEDELEAEEGKDREKTKLDSQVLRPSFKEIQKKYPDIFKEFPELRDVYHRDAVIFGEVFSNVEEAKDASEKAKSLEVVDESLAKGDFTSVLKSMDEGVVQNLAENIMTTLHTINPKLFYVASAPIFSNMLNSMWQKAEKADSNNLRNSVLNVCEFLYGRKELPKLKGRTASPEVDARIKELDQETSRIRLKEATDFQNSTNRIIEKRLRQSIQEGLDPSNEMTDFVKNGITDKVVQRVGEEIAKDERFKDSLRAFFVRAERQGYPIEIKTQIVSAYLGRVKNLIGSIKSQVKSEAMGRRPKPAGPRRLEPSKGSSSSERSTRSVSPSEVNWRETSDEDIFNNKVSIKK